MRKIILSIFLINFSLSGCSTNKVVEQGDLKYQEVMQLPALEGFTVTHKPDPVYLTKVTNLPPYKYSWVYKTKIKSLKELQIIEFGAFGKTDIGWQLGNFTGKPFTPQQFEEWYFCPNAIVNKNKSCTDSNNWTASELPKRSDEVSFWYYIGRDNNGKLYKATKQITQIGQLKQ